MAGNSHLTSHALPIPLRDARALRFAYPRLRIQHRLRDRHHRHRSVLARALEDAVGFLLGAAGAAHEDPLGALDRLAVLELLPGGRGVATRALEGTGAGDGEADRRVEDL